MTFEPERASVDLCNHILYCLDNGTQTRLIIQNAHIDPGILEKTISDRHNVSEDDKKNLSESISSIRQLSASTLMPSPADFDLLGGSVDCRSWETLDYTTWGHWRNSEKPKPVLEWREQERVIYT